jgi:uncharacterized RDD family membrane protein YckC
MTCGHCGTWNDEDDHRCHRCGRRLHAPNARSASGMYPVQTATAPDLFRAPETRVVALEPPPETKPANNRRRQPVQPSLFAHREFLPQVIPFESIAQDTPQRKRGATQQGSRNASKPMDESRQQSFAVMSATQRNPRNSPEAVIYCDAPVADLTQRLAAFAIDLSIVTIALGMALLIYYFAGGTFPANKLTIPIFGGMGALVFFLYEALWSTAGGDTVGMRAVHLRVIHFDGRNPDLRERMIRLCGSVLSLAAAGIGLLWALTDEESLTWHDHMSNTFPTCADPKRA